MATMKQARMDYDDMLKDLPDLGRLTKKNDIGFSHVVATLLLAKEVQRVGDLLEKLAEQPVEIVPSLPDWPPSWPTPIFPNGPDDTGHDPAKDRPTVTSDNTVPNSEHSSDN